MMSDRPPQSPPLRAGDGHYTAYVGPPEQYDFMGSTQFRLLATLGLRQDHKVLDFGCGSLRAGRLLISFLRPGNYYGIEPNRNLIEDGLKAELGEQILAVKTPVFSFNDDFSIPFDDVDFDFIVAQSIFSHTSLSIVDRALQNMAARLTWTGLALVTFIEGQEDYSGDADWIYPGCVSFRRRTIERCLTQAGLRFRRLRWFHPRQTWYALAKTDESLPSRLENMLYLNGAVLRDTRFEPSARKRHDGNLLSTLKAWCRK